MWTPLKWYKDLEIAREERVAKLIQKFVLKLEEISPAFKQSDKNSRMSYKFTADEVSKIKDEIPSDDIELLRHRKIADVPIEKTMKEHFLHFFAMDENWSLSRNLLGGFLVHLPEFPTYIIPSFTQAKSTGDASELKKGEGPRGLITGALEGIAIGAIVSGPRLKLKQMLPNMIIGMGLQYFSSKVFPYVGEKAGQYFYKKNLAAFPKPDNPNSKMPASEIKPQSEIKQPTFGGNSPRLSTRYGLKI